MRVLGLMSGTSVDAIDAAVVDFGPVTDGVLPARLVWQAEVPWADDDRAEVLALLPPHQLGIEQVTRVDTLVGRAFVAVAAEAVAAAGPLDAVASHGQTVHHWVVDGQALGTLQLGEPAWIHEATGVPVLSDLRMADIAAGGQGAPLVPVLDALLFADRPTAVLNLGGIANVSIVGVERPVAGDTGPANCLMDAFAVATTGRPCDVDGRMASAGSVAPELLDRLLAHPRLALPLPRSTGREVFHLGWLDEQRAGLDLSDADVMATLLEFTARTIADVVDAEAVERAVVSGGGVHNPVLMARLHELLPGVVTADELGIPSGSKEAVWCALTGWLGAHGLPGVLVGADGRPATGARRPTVLGRWTGQAPRSRSAMPLRMDLRVDAGVLR